MRATAPPPAGNAGRLSRVISLILLAAVVCVVFAGVPRNGWVSLDDPAYVTENPKVNAGLSVAGLRWALTRPHGANWHPLTSLSHMLDVTLFGLEPAGHHAVSLLLHVLNAVLLALVLFRLSGAWWRSLLVAALFALHPLRVESVAWVSERKDVLSGLFFVLTLGTYGDWARRPTLRRWAAVVASLGLGLLAKPMLVTVPFVLVLVDVWPLGRWRAVARRPVTPGGAPARSLGGLLLEKWPLLLLAAAAAVITVIVQNQAGATANMDLLTWDRRICNALISCWRYAGKSLWPAGLCVFYPYGRDVGVGAALLSAVALAAATALALWQLRRRPWLAVGWFWYLGMLVPVLGLVQVGGQAYADRYTYLPTVGLAVIVVWTVGEVAGRSRAAGAVAAAAALAGLTALGVATARQVGVWRDTSTLFTQQLAVTGDHLVSARMAHLYLGHDLLDAGRLDLARPQLEQAVGVPVGREAQLRDSLRARPNDVEAHRALAVLLAREDRVEEAVGEYHWILQRDAGDLDALVNTAWIRATHTEAGHRDGAEAVRLAERAVTLSPEPLAVLQSTLAAAYAEAGRFAEACRAGEAAVRLARGAGERLAAARYARQLARYRHGRAYHFAEL